MPGDTHSHANAFQIPTGKGLTPIESAKPNRGTAAETSAWRTAAVVLFCSSLILLTFFGITTASLLEMWLHTSTYSYGLFILPASLYLVWDRRTHLAQHMPVPDRRVWLPLFLLGLVWAIGSLANVLVVQQAAVVAMLIGLAWTVIGTTTRLLIFPLSFLFFAVPVGEDLVPILQDYTTWFTVTALKLSGVSVISDGRFITVPSGDWVVAESCSGIRYLIGSVVLGVFYSGIVYRSWTRRFTFILLSIAVPILANGLRAYSIVMLGEFSSIDVAADLDHLLYGWLFFGAVTGSLGLIGLRWREESKISRPRLNTHALQSSHSSHTGNSWDPSDSQRLNVSQEMMQAAAGGIVLLALAPLLVHAISDWHGGARHFYPTTPQVAAPWRAIASPSDGWQPNLLGADAVLAQSYSAGGRPVHLSIAYYMHQRQGAELVTSQHSGILGETEVVTAETTRSIVVDSQQLAASHIVVRSDLGSRTVWRWYWVDRQFTSNPYYAKFLELKAHLIANEPSAARITLWTESDKSGAGAETELQDFLNHATIRAGLTLTLSSQTTPLTPE